MYFGKKKGEERKDKRVVTMPMEKFEDWIAGKGNVGWGLMTHIYKRRIHNYSLDDLGR